MKKTVFFPALLVAGAIGVSSGTSTAIQANPIRAYATTQNSVSYPLTLKDDANHTVTVSKRPLRIASTTEGTDEILSALVPKRNIVLVTGFASDPTYSNITSFVKGIPSIQKANAEQVIASQPDLVLMASYTDPGVVNQIEQAHIPAYEFNDFNSIADIERNIGVVGKLVGNPVAAKRVVQVMNHQIQTVKNAVKNQKKVRVLDYSSYGYVAGSSTTVNDVIVDAGGINAGANLKGWQKVTDEEIVKMNPDVIVDADEDNGFVTKILSNPNLKTVAAVKHHCVYTVRGADFSSVSQYVTKGVADVAKLLYPKAQVK